LTSILFAQEGASPIKAWHTSPLIHQPVQGSGSTNQG
jgi:hypothetical protein